MRYLKGERVEIEGNGTLQTFTLPALGSESTDVKVLAFPQQIAQTDTTVIIEKKTGEDLITDIHFDAVKTLRNITFTTNRYLLVNMKIQAKKGDGYEDVKTVHLDRTNSAINVGFIPWAPISITLPDVQTQDLRLVTTGGPRDCQFQARITDQPQVERYAEKSLAKMYQTPLPMWGEYMWATQQEPSQMTVTQPSEVIDLTASMKEDGTLTWKAPKGQWTIIRTGMVSTGVTNGPASKEGTGYEVDKLSRTHVASHFDAFLGELGSDTVQYFQWRKGRGSFEQYHGAVVDHLGTDDTRVFREVEELGQELKKIKEVAGTVVKAKVAVIFTASTSLSLQLLARSLSEAQPARVIVAARSQYVVFFFIIYLYILLYIVFCLCGCPIRCRVFTLCKTENYR